MTDSLQRQELIELDSKVTVIRSQLDLLLAWIVDKFGQEDSFPIDLLNSLALEQSQAAQQSESAKHLPNNAIFIAPCSLKVKQEEDNDEEQQQLIEFEETKNVVEDVDEDPLSISNGDESDSEPLENTKRQRRREYSIPKIKKKSNKTRRKNHPCDQCPKSFPAPVDLRVHYRTHTGEKPYVCNSKGCGKRFRQLHHVQKHERTHPNLPNRQDREQSNRRSVTIEEILPKKYPCDQCSLSFVFQGQLRIHYRTHTGERPFVCNFYGCGKSFRQAFNLKRHEQLHLKHSNHLKLPGSGPNLEDNFSQSSILNNAEMPVQIIINPKLELEESESQSQQIDTDSEFIMFSELEEVIT